MRSDEIRDKTEKIIRAFLGREQVPRDRLESLLDCNRAGEWKLVLEDLCTNLEEYDVPVPKSLYLEIVDLGGVLEMEPKYWSLLKLA